MCVCVCLSFVVHVFVYDLFIVCTFAVSNCECFVYFCIDFVYVYIVCAILYLCHVFPYVYVVVV